MISANFEIQIACLAITNKQWSGSAITLLFHVLTLGTRWGRVVPSYPHQAAIFVSEAQLHPLHLGQIGLLLPPSTMCGGQP
jgi:hypothetical protein